MAKLRRWIYQTVTFLVFVSFFLSVVESGAFTFGRKAKEKKKEQTPAKEQKIEQKVEVPPVEIPGAPEPPPLPEERTPLEAPVKAPVQELAPEQLEVPKKPTTLQGAHSLTFPKLTSWNFDEEQEGEEAKDFLSLSTDKLGRWLVVKDNSAPSPANVLTQLDETSDKDRITYNMIFPYHNENLRIRFKIKAVSGESSQGGGVVFRFQNPENHYLVFVNVAQKAISFERVLRGNRESLMKSEVPLESMRWHAVEIVIQGPRLIAFLDGAPYLNQNDDTFYHGWAGFFTEADAVTYFDDLAIEELIG